MGNAVTFGWVFRPVLGRRSVSPGMRQMFAVISLPDTDVLGDEAAEKASYPRVQVQAKTYWLHYDKSTSTAVATGYPGVWNWSAKHLPVPEEVALANIETLPTESIEDGLKASVRKVQLFQTTNGNTVLQIFGKNFFAGTTVTIGDKTFAGPQDGLYPEVFANDAAYRQYSHTVEGGVGCCQRALWTCSRFVSLRFRERYRHCEVEDCAKWAQLQHR